jgi:citrate lyase subunit beta / citryl-CoA lyase
MPEAPLDHISGRFALPVMRSVMTIPVIVERFVEKAPASGADVLCLDLEDSVPPDEKLAARPLARKAIESYVGQGPSPDSAPRFQIYTRVNGFWSGLIEGDLDAIIVPGLNGVVISKAETPDMIREIDAQLAGLERERGIEPGSIAIMPLIETAKGVVKAAEICEASPRLTGAMFGAEDYATDMGVERTTEGSEILFARTQVAIACRAAAIEAIDTPDPDYSDPDHLRREMRLAKSLGYRGKLCIHPLQVQIANEIFRPAAAEVAEARLIVEAFEREGLARGRAAIPLGGKMVDTPIYWRAKRLLEAAHKAQ